MTVNANEVTIMNGTFTLSNVTEAIHALEGNMNRNLFTIANLLDKVNTSKLFEDGGYKNIAEYSEKALGYKKVTTYQLVRVANRFLKGQSVSPFKMEDEKDYTVSQLMELIPLEDIQINGLIQEGELNPGMTTKEIRQLVKDTKAIEAKVEEVVEDEEVTPEEFKGEKAESKAYDENNAEDKASKESSENKLSAQDKKRVVINDLTTLGTGLDHLLKMMGSSKATAEEKKKFKEYHKKVVALLAEIIDEV